MLFQCYARGDGNHEIETQVLTQDILTALANELMELHTMTRVKDSPKRERVITLDR